MNTYVIYHAAGTTVVQANTRDQVFEFADSHELEVDYVVEKDKEYNAEQRFVPDWAATYQHERFDYNS